MKEMMTVKQASEEWGIFDSRITKLCREGKIPGAVKKGKSWEIPKGTPRPEDHRFKKQPKNETNHLKKLPLPIGISEYRVASTEYYYIDKTMMIKDFLDERPMVSLFTRPRRFGKTLNMDMLKTFFEKCDEDTSIYFQDREIWRYGEYYQGYQGKYPVIFVSFKDIKFESWEQTFEMLKTVIGNEFERHSELADSAKCGEMDKKCYRDIVERQADIISLSGAFAVLSRMLYQHHGEKAVIIIDEYDVPIQQGHSKGFYDKVVDFMRNLFSGGLKDNPALAYGFLTGILRVAKESIFSGLNNLKIYSILDSKYSTYFGFTKEDVRVLTKYYNVEDKYDEICEWYDGFRFGDTDIFNPWSVINYFTDNCLPRTYWLSTGSNSIIGEMLEAADEDIFENLRALLNGDSFLTYVDTSVIYPEIKRNPSTIYSFLLVAGYLKTDHVGLSTDGDYMCTVSLPNKEIRFVYNKEILRKYDNVIAPSSAISIQQAIYANDSADLQRQLRKLLLQSASYFDTVGEVFFQGLFLGLCALFDDQYYVSSNRESGEGRFDIQLMPKHNSQPGILIELKAGKKYTADQLNDLAQAALYQINELKYDTEMKTHGVTAIYKYGVAFSGKNVAVCIE
ncbi:AAA family ATPase [Ruminococcus difficilis]|uniref:AAA family ATPase n=1 Tax=Ruminococcus difficilis TaxID=2763069 RepID=A0A934TYJ0_9FIRM|nr:AAA family ATPase [Ruminococcus difficilis]MBK6087641.1 AAA family ATPase [Ruminococcus difficilis]